MLYSKTLSEKRSKQDITAFI
ncbi:hypothetical protein [Klebsiella pneumoniae]|nr:hypothetical protein [Klebsiella pneumoniae]